MRGSARLMAGLVITVLLSLTAMTADAGGSGSVTMTPMARNQAIPAVAGTRPAPPTHFTARVSTSPVICPASFSGATGPVCVKVAFSWLEVGAGASFRIYHAFRGEGQDQACFHQLKHAMFLIGASVGARHRTWYQETDLAGAGTECYWIEAVNAAGHSRLVALAGQM